MGTGVAGPSPVVDPSVHRKRLGAVPAPGAPGRPAPRSTSTSPAEPTGSFPERIVSAVLPCQHDVALKYIVLRFGCAIRRLPHTHSGCGPPRASCVGGPPRNREREAIVTTSSPV